jgi:hypothetical protein
MITERRCEHFEREGVLQFESGEGFDEHIDRCVDCRAARHKLLRIISALNDARMTATPRAHWQARVFERIQKSRAVRPPRPWPPVVASAASVAAILISAIYAYSEVRAGRALAASIPVMERPVAFTSSLAPAASAYVPPPSGLAPANSPLRRMKVVIIPPDASVEVEGRQTPISSGLLEIEGGLESIWRVRVFKGRNETMTDVIVTEDGPNPPKIDLMLKQCACAPERALPGPSLAGRVLDIDLKNNSPAPATSPYVPSPTVSAPANSSLRRVKVVIIPPDANVEVEGSRTPISSGLLEIKGGLGSVWGVRVFKGRNETMANVIVTEYGPSPPKIDLMLKQCACPPERTSPTFPLAGKKVYIGLNNAERVSPPPPRALHLHLPGITVDDSEFR